MLDNDEIRTGLNPDPFDPASFIEVMRDDDAEFKQVVLSIPVKKPGNRDYFRVNPDPQFMAEVPVHEIKDSGGDDFYLVTPGMVPLLVNDISRRRLYTCVSRRGVHFLWPAKLPKGDGRRSAWNDSALTIAEEAMKSWVRMTSNTDAQRYEMTIAQGNFGEPVWMDKSFRDLMELGFKDRLIDSPSHPIVRELFGLI